MSSQKNDNKGYSLVEIIIVIAIMAAISGVVIFGLSLFTNKQAMECAERMQILIEHNRTVTMGKESTYVVIYKTTDGVMATEFVNGAQVKETNIGSSGVSVTYEGSEIGSTISTGVKIEFDRASGALKDNKEMTFVISRGSKTFTLTIEALTGKVRVY